MGHQIPIWKISSAYGVARKGQESRLRLNRFGAVFPQKHTSWEWSLRCLHVLTFHSFLSHLQSDSCPRYFTETIPANVARTSVSLSPVGTFQASSWTCRRCSALPGAPSCLGHPFPGLWAPHAAGFPPALGLASGPSFPSRPSPLSRYILEPLKDSEQT